MDRDAFHVFDTTLRDGAQREGISYSVSDKLAVARLLDELGVGFIEGGWPGAMPKDTEFFARAAAGELKLANAQLVAFGATRKPGINARRRRPGPGAAGLPGAGRVPGGQVRCPSRQGGPADDERGEPRDGPRHRRLLRPQRPAGVRGLRALLRRLQARPRLRRGPPEDGVRRGRERRRHVRHQRRDAAPGHLPHGRGCPRALGRPAGYPLPGRHVVRRGQHPRGGRGGGHPRAVHGQRVRGAHRQRRPVLGGRQPRAEARHQGPARRATCASPSGSATPWPTSPTSRRTPTRRTWASRRSPTRRGCTPRR